MTKEEQLKNIHSKFKKNFLMKEYSSPSEVEEWEIYFRLSVDSQKLKKMSGAEKITLEDILVYFRGINSVTIVRSSETERREGSSVFTTKVYLKYTPQSFNRDVGMTDMFEYIKKEMGRFGGAVSVSALTKPPGNPVSQGA